MPQFHGDGCLMRCCRLTMGNMVASGELNKAFIPIFSNIDDTHIIHDDLIIATPTVEERNRALEIVLNRIMEVGLKLNPEKCFFKLKRIPFLGVRITENGIQPDPNKVEFVKQATAPTSREELISFLSMIQSNSEFLLNLSSQTANLKALTQKQKIYLDSNPPDRI